MSDELVGGEYSTCVLLRVKGFVSLLGGGRDGSASAGPPLDPSTVLRVSGPTWGGQLAGRPYREGTRPHARDGIRLSEAGMTDGGMGSGHGGGDAPSGGMDSRLGASTTCLRRNDPPQADRLPSGGVTNPTVNITRSLWSTI